MILAHLFRPKQPQSPECSPLVPHDEAHQAVTAVPGGMAPVPDPLEPWPDNDPEPVPGLNPGGTGHCPTCTCPQFETRTSCILDLVVDLHEALETATAQVGTVRAILEEGVLP